MCSCRLFLASEGLPFLHAGSSWQAEVGYAFPAGQLCFKSEAQVLHSTQQGTFLASQVPPIRHTEKQRVTFAMWCHLAGVKLQLLRMSTAAWRLFVILQNYDCMK